MRSIRLRIALFVLVAVAASQVALSVFILDRLMSSQRAEIDEFLKDELAELGALVLSPELQALIDSENTRSSRKAESFAEIRDLEGRLVAGSPNLPPEGLYLV
jgi:hypothetical protein